ncbi:MAG: translational machinery protein [Acidobacteriota bacterium]
MTLLNGVTPPSLERIHGSTIMPTHAVIWMDHQEARILHVQPDSADEATVLAPQHLVHRHPKGRGDAHDHPDDAQRYFREIAKGLDGVTALLILGPASAKLEFFRYLHEHAHDLASKVVGVETADHPTDGQVVARARIYFKHSDRMG